MTKTDLLKNSMMNRKVINIDDAFVFSIQTPHRLYLQLLKMANDCDVTIEELAAWILVDSVMPIKPPHHC